MIYQNIAQDIIQSILDNTYQQGERLPSILSLAKKYDCSKGTIIKAYSLLCEQHIVYVKPQSGYYVADNLIRNQEDSEKLYNLSTGNPIISFVSIPEIKHCLNIAIELYAQNSLDVDLNGIKTLHEILPHHLAQDGIYAKADDIHIIQGVMQVLALLSSHEFPNHKKTILIEEPSYVFYVDYLKKNNYPVLTISREKNGIDLKELERIFKEEDIKFFYTIPRNHNPLGTYYNYETRLKIMELAHQYDVYILEDDYMGNTHIVAKYNPLYYYSYQKYCIYVKSFSKILPFIRIGIVVFPENLNSMFETMSIDSYFTSYHMPSLVSQATLEAYLKSSLFEKQSLSIDQSIKQKLQTIRKISKHWDTNILELLGGSSGYYMSLKLHPSIDLKAYIQSLEEKQILVHSALSGYYHQEHFNNSIRISIPRISNKTLKFVLATLYQEAINQIS